jgi:capsular exopolysaccharide synthesis family protein
MNMQYTPDSQVDLLQTYEQEGTAVRDLIAVIIRGKWLFLSVLVGIISLTILYLKFVGRGYEATASVLINTRLSQMPIPLFIEELSSGGQLNTLQNELEVLKSHSLADAVARVLMRQRYLDLEARTPIPVIQADGDSELRDQEVLVDHIVRRLGRSVSFEPVAKSDVIRITAQSKDPREAALIANTYAKMYQDRNVNVSRSKSKSIREYLQAKVSEQQQALTGIEESLQNYMEKKGVVSLDEEAKKTIEQLSSLRAQRDAVDINIRTLEKTLTSYQEQLSAQEKDFALVIGESNDPYIRLLQEQLAKLEVQRDLTVTRNPELVGQSTYEAKLKEIDAQIDALRSKLRVRTEQSLKTILPAKEGGGERGPADYLGRIKQKMLETQIEIQSLQAKSKALSEPLRDYETQFEHIPAKSIHFARLQRDRQTVEKLYLLLEEKYNQASLQEESEFGFVDLLDPAVVPKEPSKPNVYLILLLGGVLGFGMGFGAVFIREYFDPRVQMPEDLKKRDLDVLSTVEGMKEEMKRIGRDRRVIIETKSIDAHLITLTCPSSPLAESYWQMKTAIRFARGERSPQTILVTSGTRGEGKSVTAANVAVAFAQGGKKVLLVDADLRAPTLHTYLNLDASPGLSDFLLANTLHEITAQKTVEENLRFISCGKIPKDPSKLLESSAMKEFIEHAKLEYDQVIFDSPPILAVSDPCLLSTLADEVIVVVSAGVTSVRELERTVEVLGEVYKRKPRIVLNNFHPRRAYGIAYRRSGYGYYGYDHISPPSGEDGSRQIKAHEHSK